MGSKDFDAASLLLSEDFEYYMPQTQEYLRGRQNYAGLNNLIWPRSIAFSN